MSGVKTTDLDAVIAANPSNITAALVTSSGEHWDPERPTSWPATSYAAPPRTLRWTGPGDLAGARYGRLTVVGLLKRTEVWSLWLVRCQCGDHEDRTRAAIQKKVAPMCWRCDRLLRMQQGRPLEPAAAPRRYKPRNTTETILAAPTVRQASGMVPRTAMQAALAAALVRAGKV
jgi:hypothetical protein